MRTLLRIDLDPPRPFELVWPTGYSAALRILAHIENTTDVAIVMRLAEDATKAEPGSLAVPPAWGYSGEPFRCMLQGSTAAMIDELAEASRISRAHLLGALVRQRCGTAQLPFPYGVPALEAMKWLRTDLRPTSEIFGT